MDLGPLGFPLPKLAHFSSLRASNMGLMKISDFELVNYVIILLGTYKRQHRNVEFIEYDDLHYHNHDPDDDVESLMTIISPPLCVCPPFPSCKENQEFSTLLRCIGLLIQMVLST